jgi:hypothetical protein
MVAVVRTDRPLTLGGGAAANTGGAPDFASTARLVRSRRGSSYLVREIDAPIDHAPVFDFANPAPARLYRRGCLRDASGCPSTSPSPARYRAPSRYSRLPQDSDRLCPSDRGNRHGRAGCSFAIVSAQPVAIPFSRPSTWSGGSSNLARSALIAAISASELGVGDGDGDGVGVPVPEPGLGEKIRLNQPQQPSHGLCSSWNSTTSSID